jgi:hypothetical protein
MEEGRREAMRRTWTAFAGAAVVVLPLMGALVTGCYDDGDDDDDNPDIEIVAPDPGDRLELEPDDMIATFTIDADDFDLDELGDCIGDPKCGQAVLKIDGDACNAPGYPYNNITTDEAVFGEATMRANFSFCPPERRLGSHQVTISLRREDGSAVMRADGTPAEATIQVTTELDD